MEGSCDLIWRLSGSYFTYIPNLALILKGWVVFLPLKGAFNFTIIFVHDDVALEANVIGSLWSQFDTIEFLTITHSCAYIYVLPFGSSQALHTDIWSNGNGSVSHCEGIHPQDSTELGYTFQSLQPWWNQASGVACDGPLPCWCLCNNSHISGSENGCWTFEHPRPLEL